MPEGFLQPRRRSKAPVAGPRLLARFPVRPGISPRPAEAPSAFTSAPRSPSPPPLPPPPPLRLPPPLWLSGGVEPHGRACKRSKSSPSVSAVSRSEPKCGLNEPARAQVSPYHRVSMTLCQKNRGGYRKRPSDVREGVCQGVSTREWRLVYETVGRARGEPSGSSSPQRPAAGGGIFRRRCPAPKSCPTSVVKSHYRRPRSSFFSLSTYLRVLSISPYRPVGRPN